MEWFKKTLGKDSPYVLKDEEIIYHYTKDVTLNMFNDENIKLSFTNHPDYILERFKLKDTKNITLPAGVYKAVSSEYSGIRLYPFVNTNKTRLFKLKAVEQVIADFFEEFKPKKELYQTLNIPYRRGVLLYGPPGTGKTSAVEMIIDSVAQDDTLVFFIAGPLDEDFITAMKEEKRLKIFVFEELTETLKYGMAEFLTFLDGQSSVDDCYIIATTNYPEKLPDNLVERTGRFDRLIEINSVSLEDRKLYLEHFLKRKILDSELEATKDFSMAFLKELILIILKNNLTFLEAIDRLNTHKFTAQTGFKKQKTDDDLKDDIL